MMEQARTMGRVVVMSALTLTVMGATLMGQAAKPAEAAFPGEQGRIVFSSNLKTGEGVDNPEGDREIFTMNSEGAALKQLTKNDDDDGPAYTADGKGIAFTSDRNGNNEIYKMNADGSAQTRLTTSPLSDTDPSWSPNGQQIAFSRDGDINKMDSDGSNRTRLTQLTCGNDLEPAFSPDGKEIAFTRFICGGNFEVYKMKADGTSQTNLTNNVFTDGDPNWAPDGKKIAFTRSGDVFSMSSNGTGQLSLSNSPGADFQPAWSPDGKRIVFISDRENNSKVFRMKANGSNQVRLANNFADASNPDWQPK